jgi:hypothetical protein
MTDKSLKYLNALLVVTTVYLGANLVYKFISPRFEDSSHPAVATPPGSTPVVRSHRPLSHYQPIIDRNLLNTRSSDAAKFDKIHIAALKKTDLKLKLLGTVTVDSDRRYAVIEEASSRQQQLFQEGSAVQKAVIKRIFRGKVVLRVNGHDEILEVARDRHTITTSEAGFIPDAEERRTALMDAVSRGHREKIELLIAQGTNVNARDSNGITPLMLAARSGHSEIVQYLIARGADVHMKDNLGNTPLIDLAGYASEFALEVIEILIAEGASVQAKNIYSTTALMNAVRNGQSAVVELLLKEGADVDARSKTGQTALKLAADSLRKDVVAVLTDYGAMQQ